MTTPTVAAPAGGSKAPALPAWPFPVGVFDQEIDSSYSETVTVGSSAVSFPDVQIEPDGWARNWWFRFKMVATGNTAAVAFKEDFPFCGVDTVLLKGTNVPQTFGPFGGYDWMTINKYGGYDPVGDPRNDQTFNGGTAGTGFTGAEWTLLLPLEISLHDSLGDLQNMSDNSVYRVAVTAAASSAMFTTAPTTAPTIQLTVEQDSYSEPVAALALGGRPVMNAPPVPGTRQVWQQEDDSAIPAASHTTKITNGIGFAYRNVLLKLLDSSSTRSGGEANYPDPIELWLGGTRLKYMGNDFFKNKIGRRFNFRTTTADAAGGPENGIRVLSFDRDVNMLAGNDARRKLLRTQDGNVFKIVGTYGGSGTLYITSNYIVPKGGPANNSQIVA